MLARRRSEPTREAARLARAVDAAAGGRSVASAMDRVERLDALVRRVAHDSPAALPAVEASYVRAVATLTDAAVRRGLNPDRPRELLATWISEAVGRRSLTDLRTFVEAFWAGPRVPYHVVKQHLPTVQHLRRLHALASTTAIWQADPSWPDATARSALELVAALWDEQRVSTEDPEG